MSKNIKKFMASLLTLCIGLMSMTGMAFAAETDDTETETTTVAIIQDGDDTYSYATLEDALDDAYAGDEIILIADYTLSESKEIPSGVQVTIPTSSSYDDTLTGNNASGSVVGGSAYVTLTVPTDITLTVNGTLLVAGNQQSSTPKTCCLSGDFGAIALNGTITVNGTLYARGEISGTGSITANNGAEVYQMLQITDWRGGTAISSSYSTVFPFNCYTVDNITCATTYNYGSRLYAQYYVTFNSSILSGESEDKALVIGYGEDTEGLFIMKSSDASVEFDGTSALLHGNVSTGPLTIVFNMVFAKAYLSSDGLICPVYDMNITVASDAVLTVTDSMKMLPDTSLTVNGSIAIEDGVTLYVYTAEGYSSTYNQAGFGGTDNAVLTVNGTIDGTVASTSSTSENITVASGNTVSATGTATIQETTQSGTSVAFEDVEFYTTTFTSASASND